MTVPVSGDYGNGSCTVPGVPLDSDVPLDSEETDSDPGGILSFNRGKTDTGNYYELSFSAGKLVKFQLPPTISLLAYLDKLF